jgi:hypothetical protein
MSDWNEPTESFFVCLLESDRSDEQNQLHSQLCSEMIPLQILGRDDDNRKQVKLWDFSRKANEGKHFPTFRQITGSCVGNGGGQALWYLSAVEVIRLGDPEAVLLPFYLLPYGRSRLYGGLRGRGEGSFGSAFAKAIRVDGILPATTSGLPQPREENGLTWGRDAELNWSDGSTIADGWLQQSRKFLVQSTAAVRNLDEVRSAIRNYYPITIASSWGGMMLPPLVGTPSVRLNRRVTTWHHQMCVVGWQEHPQLGELYYVLNSWGPTVHGSPASDEPPGGFWIDAREMDSIARSGECFAFSQFQGFPAQDFSWLI